MNSRFNRITVGGAKNVVQQAVGFQPKFSVIQYKLLLIK